MDKTINENSKENIKMSAAGEYPDLVTLEEPAFIEVKKMKIIRFLKYLCKKSYNQSKSREKSNNILIYWDFDDLEKIVDEKCSLIAYVIADTKKGNKFEEYYYKKLILLSDFNFSKFLDNIRKDRIVLDIRIDVSKTGKNKGKIHDHGSAFRVKKSKLEDVFDMEIIE